MGTEKCTVVINVVQLDNQEAMADFHRYALWIVVFTVVIFIVLLVGALSFFPALALGPIAEFFQSIV